MWSVVVGVALTPSSTWILIPIIVLAISCLYSVHRSVKTFFKSMKM